MRDDATHHGVTLTLLKALVPRQVVAMHPFQRLLVGYFHLPGLCWVCLNREGRQLEQSNQPSAQLPIEVDLEHAQFQRHRPLPAGAAGDCV